VPYKFYVIIKGLALPLFVAFVCANDTDNAAAAHNLAVLAHLFN
jgi:hypothetical protein